MANDEKGYIAYICVIYAIIITAIILLWLLYVGIKKCGDINSLDRNPFSLKCKTSHPSTDPSSSQPASSGPVSSGPVSSGPVSSGPVSSGPVSSGPVSSGPVSSGPVSSGPVSSGPASSGPASSGPASSGPVSSGPASTPSGESAGVCMFDFDFTLTHSGFQGSPGSSPSSISDEEYCKEEGITFVPTSDPPEWPTNSGTTDIAMDTINACLAKNYEIAIVTNNTNSSTPSVLQGFNDKLDQNVFTDEFFKSDLWQSAKGSKTGRFQKVMSVTRASKDKAFVFDDNEQNQQDAQEVVDPQNVCIFSTATGDWQSPEGPRQGCGVTQSCLDLIKNS